MTIEDREYLFDHAQQLSEILNEECVELLGMLEKIEDRVAISKRINKLEDDGDHIFHAFADRLHQVEPDTEKRMTIFQMARHIEDCIDMVDELSMTIVRYNTRTVNPGMKASVNAIAGCVKKEMHLLNILRTYEPENKELFLRAINETHLRSTSTRCMTCLFSDFSHRHTILLTSSDAKLSTML